MINKPSGDENNANRDPLTGAPGAHPVGTGLGAAAGGAAAGAAAGTVAGPIGTLVGAAVGAVVGGLAGKSLAEAIDPTLEDSYWRDNYSTRPYVARGASYEDYGPAYGFGVDAVTRYPGRTFDDIEPEMSHAWTTSGGVSMLGWSNAKHAARDAWNRVNGHGSPNG
ncbi:hypothetical protein [Hydrogenophaga sp. OTU3427]|uniref:hypothetical protein n=1 Tax=Hydrogenophaga sp. OTU3427 TaxID=3043856 RepID=UPI00313E1CE7